jgi:putative transposase
MDFVHAQLATGRKICVLTIVDIENLNGKFRAECLNTHWFMSLDDALAKCEAWRRDYNEVRPHSGIGNRPPASLVKSVSSTRPTPTE